MRGGRVSFRLRVEHNGSARARKAYDDSQKRTQFQRTAKTKRACMCGTTKCLSLVHESVSPCDLHCAFVSRSLLSLAVLVSSDLCCPSLFVLLPEDRGPLSSQANINDSTRQLPTATERKDSAVRVISSFQRPSQPFLSSSVYPRHFAEAHPTSDPLNCRGLGRFAISHTFFPIFTNTKSTRLTRRARFS